MNAFQKGALLYGIAYLIFSLAIFLYQKDSPTMWPVAKITMIAMVVLACIHFIRGYTGNPYSKLVIIGMIAYIATYALYIVKMNIVDIKSILDTTISKLY